MDPSRPPESCIQEKPVVCMGMETEAQGSLSFPCDVVLHGPPGLWAVNPRVPALPFMVGASLALALPGFKYTLFGGELATRGLVTWTSPWGYATLLRHNVVIWGIPESVVFWEAYAKSGVVDEMGLFFALE